VSHFQKSILEQNGNLGGGKGNAHIDNVKNGGSPREQAEQNVPPIHDFHGTDERREGVNLDESEKELSQHG